MAQPWNSTLSFVLSSKDWEGCTFKMTPWQNIEKKKDILASLFFLSFSALPLFVLNCAENKFLEPWKCPVRLVVERDNTAIFTLVALQDSYLKIFSPALHVHHSLVVSAGAIHSLHTVWLSTQGTWEKYKDPLLWKLQLEWSADPLMGRTGECFTLENRQMARKRW